MRYDDDEDNMENELPPLPVQGGFNWDSNFVNKLLTKHSDNNEQDTNSQEDEVYQSLLTE